MKEDLMKIKDPVKKPYFSTLIEDSDDKLMFCEYPEEENTNKFNFWVYKDGREFICHCCFACDDYEFQITPSKWSSIMDIYTHFSCLKMQKVYH